MQTPWWIELFGGLRATMDQHVVNRFRTRQVACLLAYLAFYHQQSHPREVLIELLWPESDPRTGRHRLRVALSSLRHQLEPPGVPAGSVIVGDHSAIQLNPLACATDVARFEAALQVATRAEGVERARQLQAAAALYQGELLPGFSDEWVLSERQRLAEASMQALEQLTAFQEERGDLRAALSWARQAVTADPLREEAQHHLIRLLLAAGEREAAQRQYEQLERRLTTELGIEPAAETRLLLLNDEGQPRVRRSHELSAAAATRPSRGTGMAPPPLPHGNLPMQFTRFFGRQEEIERLCQAAGCRLPADKHRTEGLQPAAASESRPDSTDSRQPIADSARLITLTGPGGSGKTRLAVAVGGRLQEAFGGRLWFVPLQEVTDASRLLDAILQALRLPRSPHGETIDQLTGFLSDAPALLVLDNFEQLVEGGAEQVQLLLERTPALTCLVTSRQRLDLSGEQEFPVAPLPVPREGVGGRVWGVGSDKVAAAAGGA